ARVGIGTSTTPAYALDVNGTINGTAVLINGVAVSTSTGSTGSGASPTRQVLLSGSSATYTTPAGAVQLRIRMKAGGGGGAGAADVTNNGGNGGTGGTTIFNSVSANGGVGGYSNTPNSNSVGGTGGTGGTGTASFRLKGAPGGYAVYATMSSSNSVYLGGAGGGSGAMGTNQGVAGANTGSGGGGANTPSVAITSLSTVGAAGGGGEGEYAELIINNPSSTYTYTVGAGGTAGAAGTNGQVGYVGGSGVVIVDEYYGSGTVASTGSGTTSYISKWSSSTGLTSSVIYETGGSIGIGTTGPGAPLEIFNGSADTMLKLSRSATTSTIFRVGADSAFVLANQGTDVLTVKNGNVGIGTTGPGYKLDVNGTFRAVSDSTLSGNVSIGTVGAGPKLEIAAGTGNENIRISSNDGSGTRYLSSGSFDYPTLSYHAWKDNFLASTTGEISFLDRPGTYTYSETIRTSDILFKTAHSWNGSALGQYLDTTMVIRADQNGGSVGIGTTVPHAGLEVAGANQATGGLYNTYGNLLVSSNSAEAINVGGSIALGGILSGTTVYSYGKIRGAKENSTVGNAQGYLAFETDDNTNVLERMRITSAGNVGIGTAGPLAKLAINGGLHVGGDSDPGDNNALIDGTLGVTGAVNAASLDTNLGYGIHALGNDTKSGATYTGSAIWSFNMQGYGALFTVSGVTGSSYGYAPFTGLAMASYSSNVITIIASNQPGMLTNSSSYSPDTTGVWKSANSPTVYIRNAANTAEITVTVLGSTPTNVTRTY
ncbi:MAG: hypothetical protein Q7K44_00710, partial [Candidatus Liptonbacteria bacterium]|nr:hypothetical protein [Candidatus Liptonbacteria bacterium]